jgi:putative membrane protein
MQKNKTLKGLLAVSAVAAMFSAFGVQAQTATSSTNPNQAGKVSKDGAMDNSNSTGMEVRKDTAKSAKSAMAGDANNGAMQSGAMGASGAAGATAAGSGAKLSAADQKAVKDMAMADMAEVETAKLALSKSQNAEVKAFAQQMVDDHGQALQKVQALAQARGVTLPTEVDAKHKAMAAKLEKMSGDAFDKAYMANAGVKDHTEVHGKLVADSKKIKDADVKALADQHLPVVEQHLKSAQQMSMAKSGTAAGK